MASEVTIVWDDVVVASLGHDADIAAVVDRMAAECVSTMKYLCPVSPVGPLHRSGNLRSSIHAFRDDHGDVAVGPTADYARYVNDGTVPHIIESHGDWPLRNRETGQVFGRIVHHPGTHGAHFIERTADTMNDRRFHV